MSTERKKKQATTKLYSSLVIRDENRQVVCSTEPRIPLTGDGPFEVPFTVKIEFKHGEVWNANAEIGKVRRTRKIDLMKAVKRMWKGDHHAK